MSRGPAPHRRPALVVPAVALLAALALPAAVAAPSIPQVPGVQIVEAWPDVSFTKPMGVVYAPDGTDNLYVFEQGGKVYRLPKWRGVGAVPKPSLFLDISDRVFARFQGGLIGLAFHPQFARNGRLFACYLAERKGASAPYSMMICEFHATADGASASSQRSIIEIPKSRPNHNAGDILFGPDGMLYIATGDNQKQEEAVNLTSQNPLSLLGKILRIDVDRADPGLAYSIPRDNPWAGAAPNQVGREIYAYGFRNPWRVSFDEQGNLWVGEPGTSGPGCREWITKVRPGGNHGWPFFEGTRSLMAVPPQLQGVDFVRPAFEYERANDEKMTAAIGGFVYRGDRIKSLKGQYVFGDYGRGEVYSIDVAGGRGSNMMKIGPAPTLSSIGEDAQGELYFCSMDSGLVLTMTPE